MTRPAHLFEPVALELPFWRYGASVAGAPCAFLLDSAGGPPHLARWSYLGLASSHLAVREGDPATTTREALAARAITAEEVAEEARDAGVPFLCGAVAAFAYDAVRAWERIGEARASASAAPLASVLLVDALLAHDHATGRTWCSAIGPGAERAREELLARVRTFERAPERAGARASQVTFTSDVEAASYARLVERARGHIADGDVFELCLTRRCHLPAGSIPDAWALYERLRGRSPAPFAAFVRTPEVTIVSSSPERFLAVSPDGVVETRPMKGTRPRGQDAAADARLAAELATSAKDRAENVMAVDVARNDLGRVCEAGSVVAPELCAVERYATVHQLVSTVRGRLAAGRDALDALVAAFPPASMTGAPKIEAMRILERLEPVTRGAYAGALGWFDTAGSPCRAMDAAVAIRTFVIERDGSASFHVGGAIVLDSDPVAEWDETCVKAAALEAALADYARGAP